MPVYLTCPHCTHPMVVPPEARSRGRLCRQCGCGYIVPNREDRALPVPARSRAQLLAWLRARRLFAAGG